jgi:DNA-binding GntR family transcriptional regulator
MSGQLRPGDAVKAERIGEDLGISGTPVREALQALKVEGFLKLLPRRGFTVAPLSGKDITDAFEASGLLSGELAARAATRASDEDLTELEALHYEILAATHRRDLPALERTNNSFHQAVDRIANAPRISWVLGLASHYVPGLYENVEGWANATVHDHTAILDHLKKHDADGARAAMHAHLVHAGELLATQFDSATNPVHNPPSPSQPLKPR